MRQDPIQTASPQEAVRLLIVEDDQAIRAALVELLTGEGYQPLEAANGYEALSLLKKGPPPALILLDLMMPVMNGWEFAKHLRTDPALRSIPIVVLTASPPAGLPEGIAAYLRKPVDLEELLDTLECHQNTCELLVASC